MIKIVLLVFAFLSAFMPITVKAEDVSELVRKRCKKEVERIDPVRITYNYGELIFKANKNMKEISRTCGNNAAGCFKSVGYGCTQKIQTKSIKVNGYNCYYTAADINCDFSGARLYITNEYKGCNARAVLRHELQHFMNWKTAKENLVMELKNKLTAFVLNSLTVCQKECYHDKDKYFREYKQKIEDKWSFILRANDIRLDEVDHDYANQVNYTVCAPYSLKFGSN